MNDSPILQAKNRTLSIAITFGTVAVIALLFEASLFLFKDWLSAIVYILCMEMLLYGYIASGRKDKDKIFIHRALLITIPFFICFISAQF